MSAFEERLVYLSRFSVFEVALSCTANKVLRLGECFDISPALGSGLESSVLYS